jgi:glycosyltransferase involved in cell wall biosynthesis
LNILWVIDFEYRSRLHHGGVLRFVNYARELQALGHRVYFAFLPEPEYRQETQAWMRERIAEGVISGCVELHYRPHPNRRRLAAWMPHPKLSSSILRRSREETAHDVVEFLKARSIDAILLSNRWLLFLIEWMPGRIPIVGDFCDCYTLHGVRDLRAFVREGDFKQAFRTARHLIPIALQERHYGRLCTCSLLASPVDKSAFDRLTGRPEKALLLLNGIRFPDAPEAVQKIPGRVIFSGNMNFGPNSQAAVWFAREVFPQVLNEVPNAHLVLAGANPGADVQALAGSRITVTGYVEDMNQEIARSTVYVAPLISGGGFKNKVIEAIANRTCVIATPVAVEFLEPAFRRLLRVADSPSAMAESVIEVLRDPAVVESQLDQLHRMLQDTFSWQVRTRELASVLESRVRQASHFE